VTYGINITSFGGRYGVHLQGIRVNHDRRNAVKYECRYKGIAPQVMQCLRVGTRRGRGKGGGPNPLGVWEEEIVEGEKRERRSKIWNCVTKQYYSFATLKKFREGTVAISLVNYSSLRYEYDRISGSDTLRALQISFYLTL